MDIFGLFQMVLGFAAGVAMGITANLATQAMINKSKRAILRRFEGYWLERINNKSDRIFSIGHLYFSDNKFHYDGINYSNDGDPHYRWQSVVVTVNDIEDRIFYIYRVSEYSAPSQETFGFGIAHLNVRENSSLDEMDGFFYHTIIESRVRQTKMYRLNQAARLLDFRNLGKDSTRKHFIVKLHQGGFEKLFNA